MNVSCQECGILGKANLLLPLVLTSETKVSIMLKTCIRRKSKLLSQTFEVFLQQKIVFTAVGCLGNTLMEHVQLLLLRDNCINYCLGILIIFKIHLHCKILKLA